MSSISVSACSAVILLGLVGCSRSKEPPRFPVSGTVSYKSKPLKAGMVTFYSQSDGSVAAVVDANGGFVVDKGLKEGQYRVYVEPAPEILTPPPPGGPPMTPPKVVEEIPQKYRQAATSGLLATVEAKSSGNTFTFDMK